jgi:hypothetical protein
MHQLWLRSMPCGHSGHALPLAARASHTQEHHGTEQASKVVPSTGIRKPVDANVCNKAPHEAEEDEEAMHEAAPESQEMICEGLRLMSASKNTLHYCTG